MTVKIASYAGIVLPRCLWGWCPKLLARLDVDSIRTECYNKQNVILTEALWALHPLRRNSASGS